MEALFNTLIDNKFLLLVLISVLIILLTVLIVSIRNHNKDYNRKVIKEQLDIMKEVEEMDQKEVETRKTDIGALLETMEKRLEETSPVVSFEEEQEEKAIISYQELLKTVKGDPVSDFVDIDDLRNQEDPELLDFDINHDEPIRSRLTTISIGDDTARNHFRNTEFISPVYGKVTQDTSYPTRSHYTEIEESVPIIETVDLEEEFNPILEVMKELPKNVYEPHISSSDVEKGTEFLSALKEFRKNLE